MSISIKSVQDGGSTTDEVVQATALSPLYLRSDKDLREAWVSSQSRWHDAVWVLDDDSPGQTKTRRSINWKVALSDGSFLTDTVYVEMLDWLRRIVWSLFTNREQGAAHSFRSAGHFTHGMRPVVRWLVETKRQTLSDLTCAASWEFLDELPNLLGVDDEDQLTPNQVKVPVSFIQKLWIQAPVVNLARANEAPFDGLSIEQVANRATTEVKGSIPPLPDEVAIAILNKASAFVEHYSDDIIGLFKLVRSAESSRGTTGESHRYFQKKAAKSFDFRVLEGSTEPWHPPIADGGSNYKVRSLVHALRAACVIIVLSTTGMRISEICGIQRGKSAVTGLPICIEKQLADEGLFNLFLLKAKLTKTERTPRTVEWVVGMSPADSPILPLADRALELLNQLADVGSVFGTKVTSILAGRLSILKVRTGRPDSNHVIWTVQRYLKDFVENWVDLSGLPNESRYPIKPNDLVEWRESRGRIIKTHQFRKTFAQFAAAIDARLVEAVQDQFKHISLAMTYKSYVNAEQHVVLTSMDATLVARMMYETMFADASLAGIMGERIEQNIPPILKAELKKLPPSEAWKKTLSWVEQSEFRLIYAPHGKCGGALNPTKMRCHEIAGTIDWLAQEPNYETREPSVCAGCSCFVVDAHHKPFWRERYRENRMAVLAAGRAGMSGHYRAIQSRADQARNFLRQLGDDIVALDQTIEAELAREV